MTTRRYDTFKYKLYDVTETSESNTRHQISLAYTTFSGPDLAQTPIYLILCILHSLRVNRTTLIT